MKRPKKSSTLAQAVESGEMRTSPGDQVPWLNDFGLMQEWAGVFLRFLEDNGDDAFVGAHNFEIPFAAVHYLTGDTLYSSPATHYKPKDVLDLGPATSELTGDRPRLRASVLRKAERSEVPASVAHFLAYEGLFWIRLD